MSSSAQTVVNRKVIVFVIVVVKFCHKICRKGKHFLWRIDEKIFITNQIPLGHRIRDKKCYLFNKSVVSQNLILFVTLNTIYIKISIFFDFFSFFITSLLFIRKGI